MDEPIALRAEKILKEESNLSDNEIAILTSPTWRSFLSEIEDDLTKIVNVYKSDKQKAAKLIENHSQKYFWQQNNYLKFSYFSPRDVEREIKKLLQANQKARSKEAQKKLTIKTQERFKRIAELVDHFGRHQDERKKQMMIASHYVDRFLEGFGKRAEISLDLMRYVLPQEIEKTLTGESKNLGGDLKKRQKTCAIIWDKNNKISVFYGGDVRVWENRLFGDSDLTQINEVVGMPASHGMAIGRVRILKSPKEVSKFKTGEILIAPMTSPDYILVIKKAAAIVTNWGGVTSHAAIVSREFGIPCVVGTDIATKVFKDGDKVEVNADEGIVRKIE